MNRIARCLAPIAMVAALATLASCGVKEGFKDAEAQVARFHATLDAGKSAEIWSTGDAQLRQSASREQFIGLLDAVHRKLGKVKESKQVGWNANATTGGTFFTVTMDTAFERGNGTEEFVFKKTDQRVALAGYQIDSREMMLN